MFQDLFEQKLVEGYHLDLHLSVEIVDWWGLLFRLIIITLS